MIEVAGLDHIVLRTSRMKEMLHFYSNILGCPGERELSPEFGLVQLRAGTALIDLVAVDSELGRAGGGPPTKGNNNMDHFCLQLRTQPEEEIIRYLASQGIEVEPFERRYGAQGFGNSVYLSDPEGNIVELRNSTTDRVSTSSVTSAPDQT
jgi:catechol 2,3-dioxygenase-like lactoylglutathione lyase family enzyme